MSLSLTLKESLKLTTNTLQSGVIEILGEESKILALLPFKDISGSGYSYNLQKNIPEVKFRAIGESYDPQKIEIENRVETLAILGDEAIVDTYQAQVFSDINDLMAVEISLRTKALANTYEKTFLFGDLEKDINSFNGLSKRVISKQVIQSMGVITDDIDFAVDMIHGEPNAVIMSKSMRRTLTNNNRGLITKARNDFGVQVKQYGDMTIVDLDDEMMGDEVNNIYVVKLSEDSGVCGIQNGGISVTPLGNVGTSPKVKTRIEWFTGLAVFDDRAIVKIIS